MNETGFQNSKSLNIVFLVMKGETKTIKSIKKGISQTESIYFQTLIIKAKYEIEMTPLLLAPKF